MSVFGKHFWELDLIEGWSGSHDEVCSSIFRDGGFGALQISAAKKAGSVTDSDLREFAAEHLDAGVAAASVSFGDFAGFSLAFSAGDQDWTHWYLRSGSVMLFVTYCCEHTDLGSEDEEVARILRSLRTRSVPD